MSKRVTINELARMMAEGFKELKIDLKSDIADVRNDIADISTDIVDIRNTMATKDDIADVRSDIDALATRVKDLELAHP